MLPGILQLSERSEWKAPSNYTQLQTTDWWKGTININMVQSVLTEDPADFRPTFDPLWAFAVGHNDAESQHCRYRRKSSVIAWAGTTWASALSFVSAMFTNFPWSYWLPGRRSQGSQRAPASCHRSVFFNISSCTSKCGRSPRRIFGVYENRGQRWLSSVFFFLTLNGNFVHAVHGGVVV